MSSRFKSYMSTTTTYRLVLVDKKDYTLFLSTVEVTDRRTVLRTRLVDMDVRKRDYNQEFWNSIIY